MELAPNISPFIRQLFAVEIAKQTELAWVACLIEGEGCIDVTTGTARISISNSERVLLERAQAVLGGKIYRRKDDRPRRRPMLGLEIYGEPAASAMERVVPFMCGVKREQALLAIEFQKFVGRRGARPSEEARARRLELDGEIRALKRPKPAFVTQAVIVDENRRGL